MSTADATAADLVLVGGAAYDVPPLDAALVALILELANSMTGQCFGERRSTAATLLALHLLDTHAENAAQGAVASHSVDAISETFAAYPATPSAFKYLLATTRWGRMLAMIIDTLIVPPFVAGCR